MKTEYLLVRADALPEVYTKVAKAKLLLANGKAANSSEAARLCNISRSAFYKYRDDVFYANESGIDYVVNISAVLENRSGVLSNVIAVLGNAGANILTINQGMPAMGVALVTVSYRSGKSNVDEIIERLKQIDGVVNASRVLGEV